MIYIVFADRSDYDRSDVENLVAFSNEDEAKRLVSELTLRNSRLVHAAKQLQEFAKVINRNLPVYEKVPEEPRAHRCALENIEDAKKYQRDILEWQINAANIRTHNIDLRAGHITNITEKIKAEAARLGLSPDDLDQEFNIANGGVYFNDAIFGYDELELK